MKNKLKRPAIAMIELIFAIVIMGIVMMSAPMLISTASSSVSVALQQASINEAVSRVSMILTHEWDQNDLNDTCVPPVLHVTSGDSELDENGSTGRRIGVPLTSNSRTFKCGISEFNASLTVDGKDDIDDFTNSTSVNLDNGGTGGIDYIETNTTITIATSVGYVDKNATYSNASFAYDFPGATTGSSSTNIKAIQVTVTSSAFTDRNIVLNAFSSNIGGYEFERKVIP